MKDTTTNTYSDFSELRKIQGSESTSVTVLGRSAYNDGFGGTFYWDTTSTAPDDNTNIIQKIGLATGRWIRVKETVSKGQAVQFRVGDVGAPADGSSTVTNSLWTDTPLIPYNSAQTRFLVYGEDYIRTPNSLGATISLINNTFNEGEYWTIMPNSI